MSLVFECVLLSAILGVGQGLLTKRPFAAAAILALFPLSLLLMMGMDLLWGTLSCLAAILAGAGIAHATLRRRAAKD